MAVKTKKTTVDRLPSTAKNKKAVVSRPKSVDKKLSVISYSAAGEKKGTVSLPEALFGQKQNPTLLAQAVRVYLANQRKSHAKVKSRGEIQATTKKVYRQKGTGGARHGARSAPIFVGGGIAHGPRGIENHSLVLPRALRQKALATALSARAKAGTIVVCDLDKVEPKTGKVARALAKIGGKKSITLVYASPELARAARNIANVNLVPAKQLSTYHVLVGNNLIITPAALEELETRFKN